MEKTIKLDISDSLKQFIKDILMAKTLDDNVTAILTAVNTLVANQNSTGNAAILSALTGLQNTANQILAQDMPTPTSLAPTVTGISPNSGPVAGGTVVTITGTNLTGSTGATFGGVAGTNYSVTNDTTALVTSPANTSGAGDVIVVDTNGNSAASPADQFTYS